MAKARTARFFNLPRNPGGRMVGLVVIAALVVLALELTNTTHIFHKQAASKVVVTVGTPVAAPKKASTAQPDKASADNTSSTSATKNSGGATDTGGSARASTSQSQWTTSVSGLITVKQPAANAKLANGSVIGGSAKVDSVNYRLSDNTVGVVAEGTLSVVSGNFSGTLHFTPRGTGGRLDVFSTDSKGVEYNEVQINVSF